MANYHHVYPYVTVFNDRLYPVFNITDHRDGSSGVSHGDPTTYRCTNLSRWLDSNTTFVVFHRLDGQGNIMPGDLLYRHVLTADAQAAGLFRSLALPWNLAEDAAEDLRASLFDFWQGLKDAAEACRMCGDFFHRVSRSASDLARGRFTDAAREVTGNRHILANSWLEYNFAIAPTIGTIQDAIQFAIKDRAQAIRLYKAKRHSVSGTLHESYYDYEAISQHRLSYRGSAVRYFTAVDFQREFDRSAFTRPSPALWDAVPWSFAVDWFIPVGTWLDQLTRIDQFSTDGCNTVSYELKSHYTFVPHNTGPWGVKEAYSLTEGKVFMLSRQVDTRLGAKTWDLQGLLSRSDFGLNARRASYLCSIAVSRLKKSYAGGLL